MAIDTRTNVKLALGISGTDNDDQIDALLEPITAAIEKYAGRQFESATFTEYHFGGDPTIALREYPVTSITSVTDMVTSEALAATEYELEANKGLIRRLPRGNQWAEAKNAQTIHLRESPSIMRWRIIYVAGSTPEDVKLAFYEAIKAALVSQGGLISEKEGDYSYTRAPGSVGALPSSSIALLQSYKAGVFA